MFSQFKLSQAMQSESQGSTNKYAKSDLGLGLKPLAMTLEERATCTDNPLTKALLEIMVNKKSNLCVAADVTNSAQLLELAEAIGPHICMLKLHIDILDDFNPEFPQKLMAIATKHNFLLFEDRKFADIGNTVKQQYKGGVYKIADWAHIINAHSVPGDGVIEGLKSVKGDRQDRGLLLIAQMSSKGHLCTDEYSKATVAMAEKHSDFTIGFICQENLSSDPGLLHFAPGIQFISKGDGLGQQYRTPEEALATVDGIIVGRGIIEPKNKTPAEAAKEYQEAGWRAYLNRVQSVRAESQGASTDSSVLRQTPV